ncbi:MAG: glutamine--fructose-6-phosphate transaminase (isomerizing) [Nitrospirae bacterium]|nr:glutamine--fructose-6-phosphate transaminase (isomerizing) [Nitrospirota bacterium]
MCGIVGYIGDRKAVPILLEGLKRLEYRGYDSAGIATLNRGKLTVRRCQGKIRGLEKVLKKKPVEGRIGLGHTRWATHGRPSEENAHPHTDCRGSLVVVHNGIIENYLSLKEELGKEGHVFRSETDTEIIAHLIEKYLCDSLEEAVRKALRRVKGSYALGAMWKGDSEKIIVARSGSPLIIGLKEGECFLASDIPAILKETRKVIYLENGEIAILSREGVKVKTLGNKPVAKKATEISWDTRLAEKEGYPHFMLKEIYEQPRAIEETIWGRISEDGSNIYLKEIGLSKREVKSIKRIIIIACGTSWHAGLVAEYMLEEYTRIPVEVEYAAEFRYRNPIIDKHTLIIAISQSGETADTLAAVKEARGAGGKVISICNVRGSSITRESDGVIYTHAGPEIGVASTKAFTSQLTVLYMLTLFLGRARETISPTACKKMITALRKVLEKLKLLLEDDRRIVAIADRFYRHNNFLYLGRGKGFPIALEGALKLKEVSYIHAEGYPAAEMKHGPIALIDKKMPVVVIALKGRRYEKILSNIEEVKARRGTVIALASEGDEEIKQKADEVIYIPRTIVPLTPILAVVPLQLLAYHMAVKRGCSVDQPRNLAKSVTVE